MHSVQWLLCLVCGSLEVLTKAMVKFTQPHSISNGGWWGTAACGLLGYVGSLVGMALTDCVDACLLCSGGVGRLVPVWALCSHPGVGGGVGPAPDGLPVQLAAADHHRRRGGVQRVL